MRNLYARYRKQAVGFLALALATMVTSPAFAVDPVTTVDYEALANSSKTEIFAAVSKAAPVTFLILAVMLGIGITFRLIRRGAKSS